MALEILKARYKQLCDKRDAVNAEIAPLQAELKAANDEAQVAQNRANAIAAEIQKRRGGREWLDLKKEIAALADALRGRA